MEANMLKEQKNSKKQGDVGHGVAIGWFAQNGYTVCIPLTDSQDYDVVVEKDDGLKKVQVKTTYCKTRYGVYQAALRICGGNRSGQTIKKFDKTLVDYVFVVTEDGAKYLIPSSDIVVKSTMSLGKDKDRFRV
jgi:hypothetical protein